MKSATPIMLKAVAILVTAGFAFSVGSSVAMAQGGGNQIPDVGGNIGGNTGNNGGNNTDLGGNTGTGAFGGQNLDGGGATSINDLLGGIENQIEEVNIEDNRLNRPFVGRSTERFSDQAGRAHPRSNFDGGSNIITGGGGGRIGGVANRGGQRAGGVGTNNMVMRRSLRTRLSASNLAIRPRSAQQVSNGFQSRLNRIPVTAQASSNVQVRVENKTAFLTGVVNSAAERRRVERMARLEPGIYRIQNQIRVQQ